MKKKIFQLLPLAILVFSSAVGFSYSNSCEPKPKCDPCDPCKPCCTEVPSTVCPTTPAYNAPARVDIACGWDAFISASFLYWQPIQKGVEIGNIYNSTVDGVVTTNNFSKVNMDWSYTPAFKVGLGFSSDRDDWVLFLEYTRFHSSDSRSKRLAEGSTDVFIPHWIDDFNTVEYMSGKWYLNMDLLDLELSRPYYVGQQLIFKPFIGLRGGWIDQKYNAKIIDDVNTAYSKNKSDSWLIGPRAGLDTAWNLGEGFRLFGDIAAALFYQDYKVRLNSYNVPLVDGGDVAKFNRNNDIGYLTPNFEAGLGFGYGTYFANNEWFFDMTIGYEFHMFWNQNQMRQTYDNLKIAAYPLLCDDFDDGDLMLHGLTITARIDF